MKSDKRLNKEGQGYNSSKLVPSTNLEPIFSNQQFERESPEKNYEANFPNQNLNSKMNLNMNPGINLSMNPSMNQSMNPSMNPINSMNPMNPMGYHVQYESKQFYPYPVSHQVNAIPTQPYLISPWGMPQYGMYPAGPIYPPQYITRPQPLMQAIDKYGAVRLEGMNEIDSGSIPDARYSSTAQIKAQSLGITPGKMSLSDNDLFMIQKPVQSSGSLNLSIHHGAPGLIKQTMSGKDVSSKVAKPKQFSSPKTHGNKESIQKAFKDWPNEMSSQLAANQMRQTEDWVIKEVGEADQSQSDTIDSHSEFGDQLDKASKSSNSKQNSSKKPKRKNKKNEKRKRERFSGKLKFFDESKNYGFFVLDSDGSDMFVHYDDLRKTNISKDLLVSSKTLYSMHFTFHVFEYDGKYRSSKKAVDIKLVSILKLDPIEESEIPDPVLWAKNIAPDTEITESMLSNFFNS